MYHCFKTTKSHEGKIMIPMFAQEEIERLSYVTELISLAGT